METPEQGSGGEPAQPTTDMIIPGSRAMTIDAMLANVFGTMGQKSCCNFPADKVERWKLTSLATGPRSQGFDALDGKAIDVKYFYAHRIEMIRPEDGEIINATRCVLITPELEAYSFVSDGVAVDLARIASTFGLEPWDLPMKIKVVRTQSKNKRYFYSLVPVDR